MAWPMYIFPTESGPPSHPIFPALLLEAQRSCKVRHLNNTLANRTNLHKWKLSLSPDCSFCLKPEPLLHIVASCKSHLEDGRYTWRHNSASQFIVSPLQSRENSKLHHVCCSPGLPLALHLTGGHLRPDMLLSIGSATIYTLPLQKYCTGCLKMAATARRKNVLSQSAYLFTLSNYQSNHTKDNRK